jgi:cytochrome c oxidase subunit 2
MGRQWARVARIAVASAAAAVSAALVVAAATPAHADEELERGEELFALCAHCHGDDGGGVSYAKAPAIAGMAPWYVVTQLNKFRDGQRASHFDDINGLRMRPMARWLSGEPDVKAVAAYIGTLPHVKPAATLAAGDAAKGAALYATCSGCHGAQGEGVQAVGGPALVNMSDWYVMESLKNFKQGIRGSDPRDATGAAMRGMSMLLADDQAILDVIAHLNTLPAPPAPAAAAPGGAK